MKTVARLACQPARRILEITRDAISESPPSRKKSSFPPRTGTPSCSCQKSATCRATGSRSPVRVPEVSSSVWCAVSRRLSRALRSTLPFLVSGNSSRRLRKEQGHGIRSACQATSSSMPGSAPGTGTTAPYMARSMPSDATTTALATSGWDAMACSTSVSSIRCPWIFTWVSNRPRNSISPFGNQRPRSPVR